MMLTRLPLRTKMELRRLPTSQKCYQCLRAFSTTRPSPQKRRTVTYEERAQIPPYPYGPSYHYKQADRGLYGGSRIQAGNKVSEKNEIKTRRVWRPNIHWKRLWSDALQDFVQIRVQTRVLRTMDKVGGLDEYLLGDKAARIKELGVEGWALRWKIMQTQRVKESFEREREKLGVPRIGIEEDEKRKKAAIDEECRRLAQEYVKAKRMSAAEHPTLEEPAEDLAATEIVSVQANSALDPSPKSSSTLPTLSTPIKPPPPSHRPPRTILRDLQTLIPNSTLDIPTLLYTTRLAHRKTQSLTTQKTLYNRARAAHELILPHPRIEKAIKTGNADALYRAYCRGVKKRSRERGEGRWRRSRWALFQTPPGGVSLPAWRRLRRTVVRERRARGGEGGGKVGRGGGGGGKVVQGGVPPTKVAHDGKVETPRSRAISPVAADAASPPRGAQPAVVQLSRGRGGKGIWGRLRGLFGGRWGGG